MILRSDFPVDEVSSNPDDTDGFQNPEEPWESAPGDNNPSVTFKVDDGDVPIDEVNVVDASNVKSFTVEVLDSGDKPVSLKLELIFVLCNTFADSSNDILFSTFVNHNITI